MDSLHRGGSQLCSRNAPRPPGRLAAGCRQTSRLGLGGRCWHPQMRELAPLLEGPGCGNQGPPVPQGPNSPRRWTTVSVVRLGLNGCALFLMESCSRQMGQGVQESRGRSGLAPQLVMFTQTSKERVHSDAPSARGSSGASCLGRLLPRVSRVPGPQQSQGGNAQATFLGAKGSRGGPGPGHCRGPVGPLLRVAPGLLCSGSLGCVCTRLGSWTE